MNHQFKLHQHYFAFYFGRSHFFIDFYFLCPKDEKFCGGENAFLFGHSFVIPGWTDGVRRYTSGLKIIRITWLNKNLLYIPNVGCMHSDIASNCFRILQVRVCSTLPKWKQTENNGVKRQSQRNVELLLGRNVAGLCVNKKMELNEAFGARQQNKPGISFLRKHPNPPHKSCLLVQEVKLVYCGRQQINPAFLISFRKQSNTPAPHKSCLLKTAV